MRIAMLNSYYAPDEVGGAEHSVRWLAQSLARLGHEVTVICLGRSRSSELRDGVRVERLPLLNRYDPMDGATHGAFDKLLWHARDSCNRSMGRAVGRLLRKICPDVLHTNTLQGFSVAVWEAARALGIPVVHTLRDYYLLCPGTTMYKEDGSCTGRCAGCLALSLPRKSATTAVRFVVGVSRFTLDTHLSRGYFPNARGRVIRNGYRAPTTAARLQPTAPLRFGFIGRIAPPKGLGGLIEAVTQLAGRGAALQLLIAGSGNESYVASLRARCASPTVQFLGRVAPEEFFKQVHFTVLPAQWHEPFARVAIESCAHGVPVLASRVGGLPEIVSHRQTGLLFRPADLPDLRRCLAAAITLSATPEYARIAASCREVSRAFSPELVTQHYCHVYQEALGSVAEAAAHAL